MKTRRVISRKTALQLRWPRRELVTISFLLATVPAFALAADPLGPIAPTPVPAADALPLIVIGPKLHPHAAPLPSDQLEHPPAAYMDVSPSPKPAYLSFLNGMPKDTPGGDEAVEVPEIAAAPDTIAETVPSMLSIKPSRIMVQPAVGMALAAPFSIPIAPTGIEQPIVYTPVAAPTTSDDGGVTIAVPATDKSSDATASPAFTEDQDIVLGMKVNGTPMQPFIDGASRGGRVYLSLGALVSAMEFPIEVNAEQKKASGWFIRERNTFELHDNKAEVAGESYTLTDKDYYTENGEIYIEQDVLGAWFGMQFNIQPRDMLLSVVSSVPLPFEERERRRQRLSITHSGLQPARDFSGYTKMATPYQLYNVPYVDVNLSNSYDSSAANSVVSNYSIVAKGDFAHLTGSAYLSGDLAADKLTQARLLLGKQDEGRGLLGGLHASEFEFGDVNATTLALVAESQQGRGVTITNRSIYRTEQFDVTSFRGNAPPGWDVELYRNNVLLELQSIDSSGQYEFLNVPIYFGRNSFRIVLYGPEGQIQEETKDFYTGSTLLAAGDFTYNFSLSEAGSTVLGVANQNSDTSGLRAIGEIEYGITKSLTVAAGAAQLTEQDGEHRYITGGMRASAWGILASADAAYDPENAKTGGRLTMLTSIYDIDMRIQQSWYNGLVSDESGDSNRFLTQTTSLDLNTDVTFFKSRPTNIGFNVERKVYETGSNEIVFTNRLSQQIFNFNVTNELVKTITGSNDRLTENLTLRGSLARVLYGATFSYNLQPTAEMRSLNLDAQFRPTANTVNRFSVELFPDNSFDYMNTLTFDRNLYGLSLLLGGDSDKNYFVGMGLNFSFTKLPGDAGWHFQNRSMSDSGGALMRAFVDKNANNIHDPDEDYVENVKFTRNGSPVVSAIDKSTYVFTPQLTPNSPTNLGIDKNSLEDPTLAPATPGYTILPRQGRTALLEFPLYQSAQLEGTIYQQDGDNKTPASHLNIELVAVDGVSTAAVQSEFDGYYLFSNVRPGDYVIRVKPPSDMTEQLQTANRPITLKGADFITADITLEKTGSIPELTPP